MRILYFDQYAGGPDLGMEFRTHYMAREWISHGHDVLVVTGDRSHLRTRDLKVGRNDISGVTYLALRTSAYTANGAARFLNIVSFRLQLRRMRIQFARWRPDVVIAASTHPFDVRTCQWVSQRVGGIFVYEIRDLWPLTPRLLGGLRESHPMVRWMQKDEDFGCRSADLVVSVLPGTAEYLANHGMDPLKWSYVPNGVAGGVPAEADLGGSGASEALTALSDLRSRYPVILAYAGGHGPSNALPFLLDRAREAAQLGVGLALIGDGPLKPELVARYAGEDNVRFLSRIPRSALAAVLQTADAAYAGLAPSPLYQYGVGMNKLWDYMAAGVPILECLSSSNSPTSEAGCGWTADPADPQSLVDALGRLASSSEAARQALGRRGRDFVMANRTEQVLANRMLDLFGAAVARVRT